MAKYIAHASIDENGNIKGGNSGDQTTKEVCIRTMYYKSWQYVLRLKNEKVRKQLANNMIDLARNNNVGYDQNQRNTLLTQAKKVDFNFTKITTKCECDCSSAITICTLGAIFKVLGKEEYEKAYKVLVVNGNCATTSTLRSRLNKLGMITAYNTKEYLTSTTKAVFGDIYIKEGSHVICYIDDGNKVSLTRIAQPTLKNGDENKEVGYLQKNLNKVLGAKLDVDNKFGSKTESKLKTFQDKYDLTVDGIYGPKSYAKMQKLLG